MARSPLALVALALLLSPVAVAADSLGGVPLVLGQYGRVLSATDEPVNGQLEMKFELYETGDPTIVDPKWSETQTVTVDNGAYGVLLGDTRPGANGTPLPPALLAEPDLWLQVTISGVPMLPRLRIPSVPFALRAGTSATAETVVDDGVGTAALQDGSVTNAKLADGAVTAEKIADGSIPVSKLDLAAGKFTGLDADTLDGLDSSAFAPAGIVDTLGQPPSGSSVSGEIAAVRQTLGAPSTGTISTDLAEVNGGVATVANALGQPAGASLAADVAAVKSDTAAMRSNEGASLGGDVAAIKSSVGSTVGGDVATIKSSVGTFAPGRSLAATLSALHRYSQACDPTTDGFLRDAYPGLSDAAVASECLHDGRWHLVGTMLDVVAKKLNVPAGMQVGVTNYSRTISPAVFNSWDGGLRFCYGPVGVGDVTTMGTASFVTECVSWFSNKFTVMHEYAYALDTYAYSQRDYTNYPTTAEGALPCTASGGYASCSNSESSASFWELWVKQ